VQARTAGDLSGGSCRWARVAVAFALAAIAAGGAGAEDRRYTGDLARLRFADESAPIEASVFSLSSSFFEPGEVIAFLEALRAHAPQRPLVVVCDPPMRDALAGRGLAGLALLPTDIAFTPWPRDPVSFARGPAGELVVVGRPNVQSGRRADAGLGEFLADGLPRVDARWRAARFATAPFPFHGGQLLVAGGALWLSLHSVEPRATRLLGLDRVPVESFGEPRGVARYVDAARTAAAEIAKLYRRRTEFVHSLPAGPDDPNAPRLAGELAGGAGLDLDSYLTLVPGDGLPVALVGDPRLGDRLLAEAAADELAALAATYGLAPGAESLRRALRAAQAEPRGERLALYLDRVAEHLSRRGLSVRRLALLRVPTALLDDRVGVAHPEFLLTWNNVVLERRRSGLSAEGFASGWGAADRAAAREFEQAGATLRLLPPLAHSIVLNGGYRCASNHLRRAE
jgi:hypothetical protein